jgi:arginyl-tRNA synthetase
MQTLTSLLQTAITQAFPGIEFTAKLHPATNPKYGDYQSSDLRVLAHTLKLTPNEVWSKVLENFPSHPLVGKLDAVNGFLNITLATSYLEQTIINLVHHGCQPPTVPRLKIIIDFSSPNIAKEMHVGHLRSTIIGESLCRVLEFCGHDVTRVNHIGDWGTQFGMLISHLTETHPQFLDNPPEIRDLTKFYQEAKRRFDTDPAFKSRAQAEVVKLQSGHPESRSAWQLLCKVSMQAFSQIYDRLDVHLDVKGESFYNDRIPTVIDELTTTGLIQTDQGAKCLFVPGDTEPLMVQKSDGGYGYDSTDLAAARYRLVEETADWVLYVVDVAQSSHFAKVFKAAEMAGWLVPGKNRMTHVAFGMVCGDDGKRFKTRSGDTVKLVDLLDEAVIRAKQVLQDKSPNLPPDQVQAIAEAVGYGAVKYADLHQNRLSNYVFSFDRMLDFRGNTAVYLMYAYARICSILAKVESSVPVEVSLKHKSELSLARQLARFPEVILEVVADLQLNRLCDYLYDLANAVAAFHRDCRVLGDPAMVSRLNLLKATQRVMETGLNLLGLEAPPMI